MSEPAVQFSPADIQEAAALARQRSGGFSPEDIAEAAAMARERQAPVAGPAPAREDQLSMIERMAASRAKEEPERLEKILSDRGFATKRKGGEVFLLQGGKEVPWDPKGADLGDIADLVPEALQIGVGTLAGGAKVLGAVGAPLTGGASLAAASGLSGLAGAGLETAMQGAEIAGGFREELNKKDIVTKGVETALVPGAGKLLGIAGKGAKTGAKKAAKGLTKSIERAQTRRTAAQIKKLEGAAEASAGKIRATIDKAVKRDQAKFAKQPKAFQRKAEEKLPESFFTQAKTRGLAKTTAPRDARVDKIVDTLLDLPDMALERIFKNRGGKKAVRATQAILAGMEGPTALIPRSAVAAVIKKVSKMSLKQMDKAIKRGVEQGVVKAEEAVQRGAKEGVKRAFRAGAKAGRKVKKAAIAAAKDKDALGRALATGAGVGGALAIGKALED
jgi:hypothetical protein